MMTGAVLPDGHPYIQIVIVCPDGSRKPVNVMVDTGFNGDLALPSELIASLGLKPSGTYEVLFVNRKVDTLRSFDGIIEWNGIERPVVVFEVEDDRLLGTDAMRDSDLTVRFRNGGPVTIRGFNEVITS